MIFDSVLCVAPQHRDISLRAIQSLNLFAQPRRIYIVTARSNFLFFEKALGTCLPIHLLDEDEILDGLTLRNMQEYFIRRIGWSDRAGWYFKQFLNMSMAGIPDMADYYLVWDSDTVLLQPLTFFGPDGRVLVNPKTKIHKPYFDLIRKILGVEKQVDFSFISEHFMVNTGYMKELVAAITHQTSGKMAWFELILNAVEDQELFGSGFAEYETYGSYIAYKHSDSFQCRPLKSIRNGAKRYGTSPSKYDFFNLMMAGYAFATFEIWETPSAIRIAVSKFFSRLLYHLCSFLCLLTSRYCYRLTAAAALCRYGL
jgi:hypothetical protein